MKAKLIFAACIVMIAINVHAQQTSERRVSLSEQATAMDASGHEALAATLRTTDLKGAIDSPVTNIRLVLENRSASFYTYVSGWATFYDSENVRCGEGQFKLDALDIGEAAETDTPGLRLRCAPVTWRIVASNLLTRSSETAASAQAEMPADFNGVTENMVTIPRLEITIDGETLPLQLGNPIEIKTRKKSKMHIVVNTAP